MAETHAPFFPQLTEIAAIKATLLKQPGALHGARLALADRKRELRTAQGALKDLDVELAAMVSADPAFKNAEARKAETARRLAAHKDAARLSAAVDAAEVAVTNAELDVKRLEDEMRAWRSHLDATQCEVQLLVAGR